MLCFAVVLVIGVFVLARWADVDAAQAEDEDTP